MSFKLGSASVGAAPKVGAAAPDGPLRSLAGYSSTLHKAIDTAIQLRGAQGYSKDTPLEWMYRYARQARLVDGSSETHKMVLSRYLLNEGLDFWSWD